MNLNWNALGDGNRKLKHHRHRHHFPGSLLSHTLLYLGKRVEKAKKKVIEFMIKLFDLMHLIIYSLVLIIYPILDTSLYEVKEQATWLLLFDIACLWHHFTQFPYVFIYLIYSTIYLSSIYYVKKHT